MSEQNIFLLVLIFNLFVLSDLCMAQPLSAQKTTEPRLLTDEELMEDCREALTVVAVQFALAEATGVNYTREQAQKTVMKMKQDGAASFGELLSGVNEACTSMRNEIKREFKLPAADQRS